MVSCKKANEIDLVYYLDELGYKAQKIRGNDCWYLSPLREEKNPSFKVNRKLNLWFDHGAGKGGNLVDFGTAYYKCSVKEFLLRLGGPDNSVSFHQHSAGEKKKVLTGEGKSKIKVLSDREINSSRLLQYLKKRNIDFEVAKKFCREISFEIYNKKYSAIGFQNRRGGYELRSDNFKGSSSPKDVSFITEEIEKNQSKNLLVFEGFFNFLSFKTLEQKGQLREHSLTTKQDNFLVLNSLSFFEKSRSLMEKHEMIYLFLDQDQQGIKWTKEALRWSEKYKDRSQFYQQHKDLNEYLVVTQNAPRIKERQTKGMHF